MDEYFWGRSYNGTVYHYIDDKNMTICNSYSKDSLIFRYKRLPNIKIKICKMCKILFIKKFGDEK